MSSNRPATHNIREYVIGASLPRLPNVLLAPEHPPDGHRSSLNSLSVLPAPWRELKVIHAFEKLHLEKTVLQWIMRLPSSPVVNFDNDKLAGEYIAVPSPLFNVSEPNMPPPVTLHRIMTWLDNVPLTTVQRIMHIVYPQTIGWGFYQNEAKHLDREIFDYFMWTNSLASFGDCKDFGGRSLLLAYQPPWVLSKMDMKEFASSDSIPPFSVNDSGYPIPLKKRKHRIWLKIYDECVKKDCHWFILTSYSQWIFGCFLNGRETAFHSAVYECDSYRPTVLQFLIYWVACAMKLPGCAKLAQAQSLDLGPLAHTVDIPHVRGEVSVAPLAAAQRAKRKANVLSQVASQPHMVRRTELLESDTNILSPVMPVLLNNFGASSPKASEDGLPPTTSDAKAAEQEKFMVEPLRRSNDSRGDVPTPEHGPHLPPPQSPLPDPSGSDTSSPKIPTPCALFTPLREITLETWLDEQISEGNIRCTSSPGPTISTPTPSS
ncbi:hypothetical protein HGRIS_010977 [Hohenbuehelia grisea]|uniref:Aminotransferase-like plant mobile domain-containing protein n=1 Tax=Hohenbuehelia grisea TaxID=104357 RepID=A0ABR3IYE4_9AGAR